MEQKISKRDFVKSGLVGLAVILTGCSAVSQRGREVLRDGSRGLGRLGTRINEPGYNSNVSNKLSAVKFGDKYFNSRKSVTNLNGIEFVWAPLDNCIVEVDGKQLSPEEYFPIAGFERSKASARINPKNKTINYEYDDGTAEIFVKDPSIKFITTGFVGRFRDIPKNKRVSHISEPIFEVPLINYGIKSLDRVAYGEDVNCNQLILIPSPEYRINNRLGGIVQYFPTQGAYVQKTGKISFKSEPEINPLEVKVEREQISK